MKIIFAFFLSFFLLHPPGSSFYSQSYIRMDSTSVPLSSVQGKRVVIFAFNATAPDWSMLQSMDSLQKAHSDSLVVLAFPALDFDSSVNISALKHVYDSLGLGLTLGLPGFVRRAAGSGQLTIFQWLTNMKLNVHFNRDVEAPGQLFIISPRGVLYAVLQRQGYLSAMAAVIRSVPPVN